MDGYEDTGDDAWVGLSAQAYMDDTADTALLGSGTQAYMEDDQVFKINLFCFKYN